MYVKKMLVKTLITSPLKLLSPSMIIININNSLFSYSTLSLQQFQPAFGHYYRCHQKIIRIISLHLGGNRPMCTTYQIIDCDISNNNYQYTALETSEIRYPVQGHKHTGANGAQTHSLLCMSPALFR